MNDIDNMNEPQNLAEQAAFETVWKLMRELDIASIEVAFNGEGDSGSITDINASPPGAEAVWDANDPDGSSKRLTAWSVRVQAANQAMNETRTGITLDYAENVFWGPDGPPRAHTEGFTLRQLVEELTGPRLDALPHDWVNNDGGYGTVTWSPELYGAEDGTPRPGIEIELSIRVVNTEEYSFEYDRFGNETEE